MKSTFLTEKKNFKTEGFLILLEGIKTWGWGICFFGQNEFCLLLIQTRTSSNASSWIRVKFILYFIRKINDTSNVVLILGKTSKQEWNRLLMS